MRHNIFAALTLLTTLLPLAAQAGSSSENGASREIANCFFKNDRPGANDNIMEISEVGSNGMLPAGIYVKIAGPMFFGESTLFRLKPGSEAAVKEIAARIHTRNIREIENGQYYNISFEGIELAAISVDVNTTADLLGENIMLIKNDVVRVGDSFFRPGNQIGKFAERILNNCD
ncbi:MAG: hypothetical protein ACXWQO_03965 [Bdellovibrionota bacterium]